MTATAQCPDDSTLDDLVADRLDPFIAEQVIAHVDECKACQERLASAGSTPEIRDGLSNLRRQDRGDSSYLREVVANVKSLRSSSSIVDANETGEIDSQTLEDPTSFVNDGFELLGMIGRGGMGVVYKAREKSLDRIVAIKVLSPLLASDPAANQRFLREARSAAAVVHPNVITIHAISEKSRLPYLVMEYIEGVSLQQQLDNGGEISIENVVRIGRQLAAGLAAAHSKGVVHRDIKPGNIMLNAVTGKVLLGDFGLARAAENSKLTRTGTMVGTPAYVAPEVLASDNEADHRSDLFSLGVVLYAMCSGESPFQSDSLLGTLHRVSSVDPVELSSKAPHVPKQLSRVVMRLLQKDPQQRFQSAQEVRLALGADRAGIDLPPETTQPKSTAVDSRDSAFDPSKLSVAAPRSRGRQRRSRYPIALVAVVVSLFLVVSVIVYALIDMGGDNVAVTQNHGEQETIDQPRQAVAQAATPAAQTPEREEHASSLTWPPAPLDPEPASTEWLIVRVNKDGEVTEGFDSFHQLSDGDAFAGELSIRSNDPIEVPQCRIESSGATLRAAEGFTPTLRFAPDEENEGESMFAVSGDLTLDGLQLELPAEIDDDFSLVAAVDSGTVKIDNCRLLVEDAGSCVLSESESTVHIRGSRLHAPQSSAITLWGGNEGSTHVEDCWVTGEIGLQVTCDMNHGILIRNSRLVCQDLLHFDLEIIEDEPGRRTIDAEDSLFCAIRALFTASDDDDDSARELIEDHLDWRGKRNVFSVSSDAFDDGEDPGEQWQTLLREQDSTYLPDSPFELDWDALRAVIEETNIPQLRIESLDSN